MSDQIETANFGTVEYADGDVIHFKEGLPGFQDLVRFILVKGDELEPFKFLQSLDNPVISFPLIEPQFVKSDYQVQVSSEKKRELGLKQADEGLVYTIVTLGKAPNEATVNLYAPLVVNITNMQAAQVILLESDYSVREPLLRD